jgi:hypothetical protein
VCPDPARGAVGSGASGCDWSSWDGLVADGRPISSCG